MGVVDNKHCMQLNKHSDVTLKYLDKFDLSPQQNEKLNKRKNIMKIRSRLWLNLRKTDWRHKCHENVFSKYFMY